MGNVHIRVFWGLTNVENLVRLRTNFRSYISGYPRILAAPEIHYE